MDAPRAPPPPTASSAARTRVHDLCGGQTYVVEVNTRDLPPLRRFTIPNGDEAAARGNFHGGSTSRVLPPMFRPRPPRRWTRPRNDEDEHDEEHSNINHHKRARLPDKSKAPYEGVTPGEPGLQVECAICLEDFKAKDVLRAMPCSHTFHRDCLFVWLRTKPVCPLCRRALPARPQQYLLVRDA